MAVLESLTFGTLVRGVSSDGPTEVVSVKWFGDSAVELTYKTPTTGACRYSPSLPGRRTQPRSA